MKRDYDENSELRRYVWRNFRHALTEREHALRLAALLELKARNSSSEPSGAGFRQMRGYFIDADVTAIADMGLGAFDQQCIDRLLCEHRSEIYVNRCERCHRIVASPVACACLWCGHHWYDRRAEMVARAASFIYPTVSYRINSSAAVAREP